MLTRFSAAFVGELTADLAPRQRLLPLAYDLRLERAFTVPGHGDLHGPTSVRTVLERVPLWEVPP